ncbi:MAG: hypothetical protein IKH27_11570 [Oscillospiraceae bacterium]|nr:hypothetical protein [Oscillospiraceae bacterium]
MNKRVWTAALLAAICLTGCTSAPAGSSQSGENEAVTSAAETQAAETAPEQTDAPETEAPAVTEAPAEPNGSSEVITEAAKTNKTDTDTKILFSERGLEAVQINSADGYGEELKVGSAYLDWTLDSFDGVLEDDALTVSSMDADFTYGTGTLAVNGIVTVLSRDDPDNPNAMYLRVDNQGDFPHFTNDYRERGRYIIENSRDVFAMLELKEPPVDEQYEVAVSVSVTKLHIHTGGYDTIRVTAASKR